MNQEQQDLYQFTHHASVAAWPFFATSTIIFSMRSIARLWFTEYPFGWDDLAISISWMLNVVRMVTFQLALSATRRVDQTNPASLPHTVPTATFWALFTDAWAFLSVTLPKVGVAFLLVRIFRPRPWVRATIMSAAIGLFIICVPGFVICFVQCNPIAGQWDPYRYPETKCWPRNVQIDYSLFGSSASAFLDLAFAVYPGVVILGLQMKMWKKISTMGLMGLGLASFALGVVKVSNNATLLGKPTLTQLYTDALHIGLWNSLENDFVIMAACIPSIMPLINSCRRSMKTAYSLRSRNHQNHVEEHVLEIAPNGQLPGRANRIHIKRDFTITQDPVNAETHALPESNDKVWELRRWAGNNEWTTTTLENDSLVP